jgi:hypothetical protein
MPHVQYFAVGLQAGAVNNDGDLFIQKAHVQETLLRAIVAVQQRRSITYSSH